MKESEFKEISVSEDVKKELHEMAMKYVKKITSLIYFTSLTKKGRQATA
ncbi:hypothetical protein JJG61_001742 [Salmonella enterica subsp. enterica serovar Panama]|nr:hypothetical protein [Salmonella enterica subsp. enterica serovar Panama]